MKRKLSEHPIIVAITTVSAICAIIYFLTDSNLPGLLGWVDDKNYAEPDTPPSIEDYVLEGSIEYFPDLQKNETRIGGIWKLQNIHEDASSFSQAVRVYDASNPESECFGSASYGTALYKEEDTGSWWEAVMEIDELAQYDYPKGTFGTFSADMADILHAGSYICELAVVINQERYVLEIPLEINE